VTYPGGKGGAGVAQTIINQMPPHELYIEAFAGGASVYQAKRPAAQSILIEKDAAQIPQLEMIARDSTEVVHGCAISFLSRLVAGDGSFGDGALIYLDPPYVRETRTRDLYRHEMSDDDHLTLLDLAKSLASASADVVISGYPSAMYDRQLSGWRRVEFQAMTRGGLRTECLWMNYPEPDALHDYRYLGENRTERQRIRRKIHRWKTKLTALPALERKAILAELADPGRADDFACAGSCERQGGDFCITPPSDYRRLQG
jgi:16S rRNA G966 N2-methylase RsmD